MTITYEITPFGVQKIETVRTSEKVDKLTSEFFLEGVSCYKHYQGDEADGDWMIYCGEDDCRYKCAFDETKYYSFKCEADQRYEFCGEDEVEGRWIESSVPPTRL